jgi:biuret amidohydrolase
MQRAFGLEIPETLAEACLPSRTALIVYDMQVGVLRQIAAAQAVTSSVTDVLGAARQARIRTIFTRHLSLPGS